MAPEKVLGVYENRVKMSFRSVMETKNLKKESLESLLGHCYVLMSVLV